MMYGEKRSRTFLGRRRLWLFLAVASSGSLWAGVSVAAEDDALAKKHFKQGTVLYDEGNYEAALVEFKASYEAKPNWKMRYYLGVTLVALHEFVEAEKELNLYLEEGGKEVQAGKRKEVEETLSSISGVIGTVKITTDVEGATVYCNGNAVGETPLPGPLRLNVGKYKFEIKKAGFQDHVSEVEIPGGETVKLQVEMKAAEAPSAGQTGAPGGGAPDKAEKKKKVKPAVFYGLVGTTGALLIGTAVTGGLAMAKHMEFDDTPESDLEKRSDLRSDGRTLNLVADILFGVTAASAAAMIVVAFFTDFPKKEKRSGFLVPRPEMGGLSIRW